MFATVKILFVKDSSKKDVKKFYNKFKIVVLKYKTKYNITC